MTTLIMNVWLSADNSEDVWMNVELKQSVDRCLFQTGKWAEINQLWTNSRLSVLLWTVQTNMCCSCTQAKSILCFSTLNRQSYVLHSLTPSSLTVTETQHSHRLTAVYCCGKAGGDVTKAEWNWVIGQNVCGCGPSVPQTPLFFLLPSQSFSLLNSDVRYQWFPFRSDTK